MTGSTPLPGCARDTGQSVAVPRVGRNPAQALARLDELSDGADFLLGHNLIDFDLPHLRAASPNLRLLDLPAVDTLRLNPLAFPRNPYHHLVKHYQDGSLVRGRLNDPELDARLVLEVFENQQRAFRETGPELLTAWHWLTTTEGGSGFDLFFSSVRRTARPSASEARVAIHECLAGSGCRLQARQAMEDSAQQGWEMAYALAWLSVSGSNSVMPPWVRHQFPGAGRLVRQLRDRPCGDDGCDWCRERHDARGELSRWFGFNHFRPEPAGEDGRPLQQTIVEAAMAGEHLLGIMPTGAGKSLCYQLPALSRYDKTGALTVVISPLVALMADQVAGMNGRGIGSCVTVNGMLSMPERADALERIRLGDAGIVIISPEQLRSVSLRRVLDQREIGCWVLDEAHCLSRWGHDFRPDYRYVGRFIRERAGDDPVPPVLCLTATAKPDVKAEITDYFREELGIELRVFDGGARRTNLDFVVVPTRGSAKFDDIHQLLQEDLPDHVPGGAIHLLRHPPAQRGGGPVPAGKGRGGGPFPRGTTARDQEARPGELHPGRPAGHSGHQRLRHGHRQTRRAAGGPRRHSGFPGELPAGGGQGRPGPEGRPVRAALRPGRRGAPVRDVGPLPVEPSGDPWRAAGPPKPRPEEATGR